MAYARVHFYTLLLVLWSCQHYDQGQVLESTTGDRGRCRSVNALELPNIGTSVGEKIFNLSAQCVFNREHHLVHIKIHQRVFEKVLNDGCAGRKSGYGHVEVFSFDGHTIRDVGIRVRGNTSKCNPKRQFRFKFNLDEDDNIFGWGAAGIERKAIAGTSNRRFFGLKGFSLRASANDPTGVREHLSGKVFRQAALGPADANRPWRQRGGLVYRSAFASLFVTNGRMVSEGRDNNYPLYRVAYGQHLYDPKGLYLVTENIDKTFLLTRFQRTAADSVKGVLFQADKALAHFTEEKYQRRGWQLERLQGKKPKSADDFRTGDAIIRNLLRFLASNPSEVAIQNLFDMDSVNAYVASVALTTHWDSMVANRNNDYLFFLERPLLDQNFRPVTDRQGQPVRAGKWHIIIWDLDNTLWDTFGRANDVVRNPYEFQFSANIYQPAKRRDMRTKLLQILYRSGNDRLRSSLKGTLKAQLQGYYQQNRYEPAIDRLSSMVKQAIGQTRALVRAAGWERQWGEFHSQAAFDHLKAHARVRRQQISAQIQ